MTHTHTHTKDLAAEGRKSYALFISFTLLILIKTGGKRGDVADVPPAPPFLQIRAHADIYTHRTGTFQYRFIIIIIILAIQEGNKYVVALNKRD